ncbi:pyridoxal phosphate-dependent decarboxylase family protein [Phenylobacterium montanum]|uniref:Aspartate aminotransferase family protein n=1 Tax=Phenylobacterium montanum TaxID=2823693 RepID=A0A975G213_9CAUL|nr:pyridoxal-dependent decarboxylase [Caulobacter sp. S6]QUD89329.1 aspartate aminotransferase family protein [Caulobacter sp. S6]
MSDSPSLQVLAQVARAAAAYRSEVDAAEHTPVARYADILAEFAGPLPERPGDAEQIIADLIQKATPGIRASTGRRFFGWVIGGSHPTGVAADWLTAAWGQNAGNVLAAPAASAVEAVAAGWLLDLLDLPRDASVGFVTGATVANFVCLSAARSEVLRRSGWDVEADGLYGAPKVEVVIGADAHATVYSGLKYLGLGARRARVVATDADGAMLAEDLERVLSEIDGPTIVIAQAGQINTGACDPFKAIAPACRAHGAWLHVDGAFGLWARACPKRAHLAAGVELADSWATDGHKWLQTPYDSGYAIVRDPEAHRRAMAISASYLPPAEGSERDPSAYVPELSRRARGFATWAMIRQFGRAGIADMVERCCAVASEMADRLAAEPGVALVRPVTLNQFMLRFGDDDAMTRQTIARVQDESVCFVGPADWRGRTVMRLSVSSAATTEADAAASANSIARCWRSVRD